MKVLIVKTSSMGDVIHTLPALTDAANAFPEAQFDWVVEKSFQEIPAWHKHIHRVIPVELRAWCKNPLKSFRKAELQSFYHALRQEKYDVIIDAQGLTKSALLARVARGNQRHGLNQRSARDKLAFIHYHHRHDVSWEKHAVERVRELFSQALGYSLPKGPIDYGLTFDRLGESPFEKNYLVFLHGTTWTTKHWPESHWRTLAQYATGNGFSVYLNSGNDDEYQRAKRITTDIAHAHAMPYKGIDELASIISNAQGTVAVDTGLGHLAAALAKPTVSIYGATDPKMTGAYGRNQAHLTSGLSCSPCFKKTCHYEFKAKYTEQPPCAAGLRPELIWDVLSKLVQREPNVP